MGDRIVASTLGEMEQRLGVPPVEVLLAERDELVQQVAPLRAKHGPFGTFDALRKIELATLSALHRAKAVQDERKVTEAALDELAHSDSRYAQFIADGTREKAELAVLENRIVGIADTIQRGNMIGRFLTAEIGLSR